MCNQPARASNLSVRSPFHKSSHSFLSWGTYIPSCSDPSRLQRPLTYIFLQDGFCRIKGLTPRVFKKGPRSNAKCERMVLNFKKITIFIRLFSERNAPFHAEPCDISGHNHSIANFVAHAITWKFGSRISRVFNIAVIYQLKNWGVFYFLCL